MSEEPIYGDSNSVEFRTTQCKPFKILFDALKENITDVDLYFSSNSLNIYTLDRSKSVLINVDLEGENFDHYYCKVQVDESGQEVPTKINVSVHNITKVLKTITNDDDILIWTYNPDKDFLTVIISSSSKQEQRSYEIKLQESEEDDDAGIVQGINDYSFVLTMPCSDFQRICRDLKQMNVNTVTISHDGKMLMFQSKSEVASSSIIRAGIDGELKDGDESSLVFCKVPDDSMVYKDDFKFDSLHNFSKCANIGAKGGKIVQIYMSPDNPIILIFNVGKLGKILFVLAAKEEEES